MAQDLDVSITQFLANRDSGTYSAEDFVRQTLDAIEGDSSNAFVHVFDREETIARAQSVDAGEVSGPLAGVPIAIKDNMCVSRGPTTAASRILEGFESPYDATVVQRLEAAGAILVGKTNLDEFAMGSSNETSCFGPVENPSAPGRIPGGSSGGSAAAVAARLCIASLGSDTGGSIRQPASHCGVVGMKPTYGRVSRFGLIAFASSLDQIGPLTRTVDDSARVLEAIAGRCEHDMTSVDQPVEDWIGAVGKGVEGMRIGLPKEYFSDSGLDRGLDEAVEQTIREAVAKLEDAGAEVVEVSLPHTKYAVATYYLIATAEASSNLARFDGVRYGYRAEAASLEELYRQTRTDGFGEEVQRRIMLGTYVLSAGFYDAYYKKAQKVRTLICEDFEKAFAQVDALVTPTAPTPAFELGAEKTPLQMYLEDIYTIPCNLAGLPGISVPCGRSGGLPVGLQILGRQFDEHSVFRVAGAVESSR